MVDLSQYLPILLFLGVALALSSAFVFLPMAVSRLTGAHKPNADKLSEYECGFPAFEDPRSQFDVRFYLIAILFIVFDLEAAFLFPWAVSLDEIGWAGWATMMVFILELVFGLIYAWKKGALDWE
ncbi:NADH-quinone oxidoreductase subunit A [Rhizorhapis suberifaciens]|uniref:NADH-quinone oxidoreductase subunit A n=1 Tax=Rhizorhapis suberifaciens TaxID=13656 RepID=A0A840HTJ7_9SPHN|nr:NADH-quinone oxidoreductase subunit A [Rhizorhapis suberifaciens]MBB4641512.1 NADH-quinone oxidoreductase subunit A [Rhizorhapis suberifaciens]